MVVNAFWIYIWDARRPIPTHIPIHLNALTYSFRCSETPQPIIFSDRTAIDSKGRIFNLNQPDHNGILQLAKTIAALPKAGVQNQWRVHHEINCRPIHRIFVAHSMLADHLVTNHEEEFVETNVYGFDKHRTQLEKSVKGFTDLPAELWELTGPASEGRRAEGRRDDVVIQRLIEATLKTSRCPPKYLLRQ